MARKIPFRRPQGYVADVPEAFRTVSELDFSHLRAKGIDTLLSPMPQKR
jgi:hypothetical protein